MIGASDTNSTANSCFIDQAHIHPAFKEVNSTSTNYTPDLATGSFHKVTVSGGTLTINNPTNAHVDGERLVFLLINTSTGGTTTITWGNGFTTDVATGLGYVAFPGSIPQGGATDNGYVTCEFIRESNLGGTEAWVPLSYIQGVVDK
jgi:hypothetical protein